MRLNTASVIELVTQSLPLSDWNFAESVKTDSYVIYNSQWCRMKFFIEKDRTQDTLHVFYGRLNAVDNAWIMKWNGKNCYCWLAYYDLQLVLKFLDGVSPQDAYQQDLKPAPFTRKYHDSEFAKSIINYEERFLKLHAALWKHYGLRFFELFDLRHADSWEQYIDFLREYYRLDEEEERAIYQQRGMKWEPRDPPRHQKC